MGRRFLCLCLGEASSWVVVRGGGGGGDSRTLCVCTHTYLFMWVSCQMGRKAYFSLSFCARSARRKQASLL